MTLYLQIVLGFTAIHAGLTYISWTIGTGIGAGVGGQLLVPRLGRTTIHLGLLITAAGVLLLQAVVHWTGGDLSSWDVAGPLALFGLGLGLVVSPLFSIILAGVGDDEVGSGSGVLNAMQQLGSAVGVAVLGTVYFSGKSPLGGLRHMLWVIVGLMAVISAMTFLLPREGRPEDEMVP